MFKSLNGKVVECTEEDIAEYNQIQTEYANDGARRKLAQIKEIRLQKLIDTDYLAMSDNVMSDEMKAFRKSMRDVPQNFSTEEQYD